MGMYGKCKYCDRDMTAPGHGNLSLTWDHKNPLAGLSNQTKRVRCCWQCNQLKGDFTYGQWHRIMQVYPKWWKVFRHRGELLDVLRQERVSKAYANQGLGCEAGERYSSLNPAHRSG